jgi:LEA14-like dessication related protein
MKQWWFVRWSRLLGIVSILLLSSCSFLDMFPGMATPKLEKPTIELLDVKLGKYSVFKQDLVVRLKVSNPNKMAIPIASMSCSLKLEDMVVANGRISEPFVVPASGEYVFDMQVTTSILQMSKPISKLLKLRKEIVDYQVSGRLKIDILFVGPFSFEKKGQIRIER